MSFKSKLINEILKDAATSLALLDTSDVEEEDVLFEALEDDICTLLSCRYSVKNPPVPKSCLWVSEVLPSLDDRRFQEIVRVNRAQFNHILNLIEGSKLYCGNWSSHQLPVSTQLAISLYRLGSYGDGATASKISALFGVGDGGSIERITNRFFKAMILLETDYVSWPSEDERAQLVRETMNELPNCVGYLDGCDIPLAEKPSLDGIAYFSRKQRYCVKMQAICDKNLRIRHTLIGFPGSVHDARIFANSSIGSTPTNYLSGSQWIAADSAYKLTEYVVTPFRSNATFSTAKDRKTFNRYFSKFRVRIEHAFGRLKNKFASLKEIRIRIKDKESHRAVCTWIRVCCILHNLLIPLSDPFEDECTLEAEQEEDEAAERDDVAGNAKREQIFRMIFE